MTDDGEVPASVPAAPEIRARRRISFVWIIPIVALAIGGWLAWKTLSEKGPTITITLATASGLEAGTTKVRYRDVNIGTVTDVALSADLKRVVATAEMQKAIAPQLTEGTSFWVVEPRLSASGVSGLGTLFSGSYIAMRVGSGAPKRHFDALEDPPVLTLDEPGRRFLLKSDRLGSVDAGSPIYFRGIQVGQILGHELDADNNGVTFFIFVDEEHQDLVKAQSRFWNASGVDVSIGAGGVNIHTESLQTILTGGVAFDIPPNALNEAPAAEGTAFSLFPSKRAVDEAGFVTRVPYLVEFSGSVGGLQVGAPVTFRGMKLGRVTAIDLVFDPNAGPPRIPVTFDLEPQRIQVAGGLDDKKPYEFIQRLVKNGLRAQLQSASLLTGDLQIALDFFPDAAPAVVDFSGRYPQIPSIPSSFDILSTKATEILDKLAALPLPQLIDEARKLLKDTDGLIAGEGSQAAASIPPLLDSLRQAADAARQTLTSLDGTLKSADGLVGEDSRLRYDLIRMLEELTQTARSLRALGNTLDRQPQSVIFGIPEQPKP